MTRENPRLFPIVIMTETRNLERISLAAIRSNLPVRITHERETYSTPATDALDTVFLPTVPPGQVRIEILFEPGKSNLEKVDAAISESRQ